MKIVSDTVHELAMTYCHYITMRLHFRAEVLMDSESEHVGSLSDTLCGKMTADDDS
jgi:hypothetical protein